MVGLVEMKAGGRCHGEERCMVCPDLDKGWVGSMVL